MVVDGVGELVAAIARGLVEDDAHHAWSGLARERCRRILHEERQDLVRQLGRLDSVRTALARAVIEAESGSAP